MEELIFVERLQGTNLTAFYISPPIDLTAVVRLHITCGEGCSWTWTQAIHSTSSPGVDMTDVFCKGLDCKYFGFCRLCGFYLWLYCFRLKAAQKIHKGMCVATCQWNCSCGNEIWLSYNVCVMNCYSSFDFFSRPFENGKIILSLQAI